MSMDGPHIPLAGRRRLKYVRIYSCEEGRVLIIITSSSICPPNLQELIHIVYHITLNYPLVHANKKLKIKMIKIRINAINTCSPQLMNISTYAATKQVYINPSSWARKGVHGNLPQLRGLICAYRSSET